MCCCSNILTKAYLNQFCTCRSPYLFGQLENLPCKLCYRHLKDGLHLSNWGD